MEQGGQGGRGGRGREPGRAEGRRGIYLRGESRSRNLKKKHTHILFITVYHPVLGLVPI